MVNMNLRPTRNPENMELHRAMFKRNGNCGYVPKSGNLLTKLVSLKTFNFTFLFAISNPEFQHVLILKE